MAFGWAVLGTGRHIERYIAPAIRRAKDARFVGVFNRDRAKAAAFAATQGALKGYDNLDSLLADPEVEAVFVATPNRLHAEHAVRAAAAGKHVLCEKPMATTVEDARRMVDACRRCGVKLGLGFHLRHHAGNLEAQRLISAGVLGDLVIARAQWSYGGPSRGGWWEQPEQTGFGGLAAVGVHMVDLFRFLLGREIEEVAAFAILNSAGLDETVSATLRFQGGAVGSLICGRQTLSGDNDFVIFGTQGRLDGVGLVGQTPKGRLVLSAADGVQEQSFDGPEPYTMEIEAFQRTVQKNRDPDASGEDGLKSTEVLAAIVRSYREGKAVSVVG